MLRTFAPLEGISITLDFDDPANPTTFWVRPVMERQASAMRLAIGDKPPDHPEVEGILKTVALGQIVVIENVPFGGRVIPRVEEPERIAEILACIPKKSIDALTLKALDVCMLTGEYAKNFDGSSVLIASGSGIAASPASITDASRAEVSPSHQQVLESDSTLAAVPS